MTTPPLAGKKVLYAITDPAGIRLRLPPLFKKVFDLTFVLAERLSTLTGGEVRHFDTLEDALAYGRAFDVLILQAVGNFVVEYRFLQDLDAFLNSNPDVVMMSFPPPPSTEAATIPSECRMLVVNMEAWTCLGHSGFHPAPVSGERRTDSIAADGVHSDLAPIVSEQSDASTLAEQPRADPDIATIADPAPLLAFPQSVLRSTLYIWPEVDSERLHQALTRRDPSLVDHPEQRRWIRLSKPRPAIWIYNSEPYRFGLPLGGRDAYFGPAAGFKYLDILAHNPAATFVFYDQNPASLHWIEALKRDWDGDDFPAYLERQPRALQRKFKSGNASIAENQQRLLREFGGEDRFGQLWRRFRSASARFAACDLFDPADVEALISAARAEAPFFYHSNIFSTNFTLARFSREQADERYRGFKAAVTTRFPRVILHGADVAGRWH